MPPRLLHRRPVLLLSLAGFILVYASSFTPGYGYFIDEFYYIACANNPAFGYVDHPPLAPLVLTLWQFLFGSSLAAIRVLPALAYAATVFLTGTLAKEIGGGTFAQVLAGCAMACAPSAVAMSGFYSMNAFEPLIAVLVILQVLRMVKDGRVSRWWVIGLFTGLGIMNKHTFVIFVLALIASLLLVGRWRLVANRWFFAGMGIAAVLVLPNIAWQVMNDFPSLEFYRNIGADKNVYTPPLEFLFMQAMTMSFPAVPVWLAGTVLLLASRTHRPFAFLSVLFILLLLFMMGTGTSRSDRLIFAYPGVFAGGAIFIEGVFARYRAAWAKPVLLVSLVVGLALALPVILPCVPYEMAEAQTRFLGLNTELERGKKPPLPQLLADRIGWEEKVALVVKAWNGLSPEDRNEVIVAADNYGQAGAIELFGRSAGLPPVASGHNTYYLWSKDRITGSILLQLERENAYEGLSRVFSSVTPVGEVFRNPYVSSHENNLRVFLCRGPRIPPAEMLERARTYH